MRVIDYFKFNIADKVKFKDTKNYLDYMLQDLGLYYKEISFRFEEYLCKIDKLVNKYPNLEKYRCEDQRFRKEVLSNFMTGYKNADKEDWNSIFEIASKVPRGFNILPIISFEQIDWFDLCSDDDIDENSITIRREYDDGNKYNTVTIDIDVTTDGKPRDTADLLKKLEPYLGSPIYKGRNCIFEEEEKIKYKKYQEECRHLLDERLKEVDDRKIQKDSDHFDTPFVPNLADKKKIKAAFKNTDFTMGDRKGLLPGMNHVTCIDKHNYYYEVLIDRTQTSPDYFYFYFNISGCNFEIDSDQIIICAASEEESIKKLVILAEFCQKLKNEFGELLAEYFGNTPEWYYDI